MNRRAQSQKIADEFTRRLHESKDLDPPRFGDRPGLSARLFAILTGRLQGLRLELAMRGKP